MLGECTKIVPFLPKTLQDNFCIRGGLPLMGGGSQQMEEEMGRVGHSACSMGLYKNGVTLGGLECPKGHFS